MSESFKSFTLDEAREFMLCPDCGEKFPHSFEGLMAARTHAQECARAEEGR